ncbi:DUF885 domain-containing protein [Duganella qianjiadongensis]|uniref:DUF885 family protein n=1 Tax=Duganella qianjiadongensis TaxID=2692176 RepID=A0ABW9VS18_9BURK|nr:DUF885 domain-containing protein [Duganella qianjiadongensis]MYM41650.1 DUF885 family protein [Duganella qianjiadongensis]
MPIVRRPRSALTATLLAAALLGTCATLPASAAPRSKHSDSVQAGNAQQQLARIAADFHRARCRFDPLLFATANGDSRYDDQLGLAISPKVRAQQFNLYRAMQKQLMALKRNGLNAQDQLTFELLTYELNNAMQLESFPEHLLPLNHFDNVPSTLANYADGNGSQPLNTVAQYRAYLSRLNQLPGWIDQAIVNMRAGIRSGVVQPAAITQALLPQMRALRASSTEASIYYSPVKHFPASFSAAEQKQLSAAFHSSVEKGIAPALNRLVQFLETDYLPASRASTGWSALPNGAAWYAARIKDSTNLPLSAETIHALGLKEVARIQQQIAEVAPKLGYTGPAKLLPQWVAKQDQYRIFSNDEQVLDAYRKIYAQVQEKLPTYFSLIPKAQLELHLEPELTRATASDHYTPPAGDGSHPGVFWPVVNDPKQYSRVDMVSLFLHEGVPGHHLHAALLKELDLPDFRKFSTENQNSAAYTEGWALYSETLGREMGLYEDPVAYFGHLNAEMLRAARLVVDTGMHAQGWSREQAIAYLVDTLGWPEARAKNQIERYMVWPAQALSYKIGALKIQELRKRAQDALGDKFSFPQFHAVVIGDGTLPLPILEARVNRWIAATR